MFQDMEIVLEGGKMNEQIRRFTERHISLNGEVVRAKDSFVCNLL